MGNDVRKEMNDKYSLRGRVYTSIRNDIINGVYKDHEELREVAIGEQLGVSRTPVREALRQLELEGLVEIVPNKGAYVTSITPKDVHDIYMIRSVLEGMCARWATENITPEKLDELEEVLFLSEYHASKGHGSQVAALDNKFHEILYQASNSRRLQHMLTDLHEYVYSVRTKNLSDGNRSRNSTQEHREIVQAMRQKDALLAEKLANQHVINAYRSVMMKDDYGDSFLDEKEKKDMNRLEE